MGMMITLASQLMVRIKWENTGKVFGVVLVAQ